MRRSWGLRAGVAAFALGAVGLAPGAAGAGVPRDPAANIPLGPLPAACARAPRGGVCERASIRALDSARAKLGLGPYLLPRGFTALAPARQWLVLANLDRGAYALRSIPGLSARLDAVARAGALAHRDPDPSALLAGQRGAGPIGFASNWAGGQANALLAYYGWMYDDGYGGPNLDCPSPSAPGCWGHRHDVLAFPAGGALTMGGAAVGPSYALTIVVTPRPAWRYGYTWARARAEGAGRR